MADFTGTANAAQIQTVNELRILQGLACSAGIPVTSSSFAIGTITISPTATELKAGASALANRRQMFVVNDSSVPCFFNFDNPPIIANGDSIIGFSGEAIVIDLDPNTYEPWYVVTNEVTTTIRVFEIA